RGDNLVININGSESTLFDEIKPMGFWWDGKFVFAARSGDRWRIYKGDEEISDIYRSISEVAINLYGTAAGASAALSSGKMVAILFSDEYREPLISKQYNSVSNIALHPEVPLLSFGADWEGTNYVVLSSTEYFAGPEYSKPAFSYDGSELYFIGCDIDCFVSINGRRCPTKTMLEINYKYAYKPGSRTMAYSTSSTMIVRYLDTQELYAGMMVDRIIPPRYNWRMRRYETLGNVSGKLYLLTCRV
ncbi:MAG: hypothetical protein QG635_1644, partial [Bacteroidota bacterium]|nr:hypothetical protein [Bacteroidota bacterium]